MSKIAIFTGASRGLGKGVGEALLKLDYKVIFGIRDISKLDESETLENKNLFPFKLDVTDIQSIESLFAFVKSEFNRLDCLINNAGVFLEKTSSIADVHEEALMDTFDTNFFGAFRMIQKALPMMYENNYGRIVNVSSGLGEISSIDNNNLAYRASKTALNVLTKNVASEIKNTNIFINSVCPGWVKTDMGGSNATRELEQGVQSILFAATVEDKKYNGMFLRDGKSIEW